MIFTVYNSSTKFCGSKLYLYCARYIWKVQLLRCSTNNLELMLSNLKLIILQGFLFCVCSLYTLIFHSLSSSSLIFSWAFNCDMIISICIRMLLSWLVYLGIIFMTILLLDMLVLILGCFVFCFTIKGTTKYYHLCVNRKQNGKGQK